MQRNDNETPHYATADVLEGDAMTAHPSSVDAWCRYCLAHDVSILHCAAGTNLLQGPHAVEWLARGFSETLKAIRNNHAN